MRLPRKTLLVNSEKPRPAGRPRSEAARTAILNAGYKLLAKDSVHAISVQQIAAEAGVSTATLYRWWPTKEAVLLDAYMNKAGDDVLLRTEGSPLHRVRQHALQVSQMFRGKEGKVTVRLLMAIQENEALRKEFFERMYLPKLDRCLAVLKEAVEKGELPPGTDFHLFMDSVFGVMLIRLLVRHENMDDVLIGKAFDFAVAAARSRAG